MQEPSVSTPAATSRAVRLESFGGPEVLDLREVPAPQAGRGQIRVRVTAATTSRYRAPPLIWRCSSGSGR